MADETGINMVEEGHHHCTNIDTILHFLLRMCSSAMMIEKTRGIIINLYL